MIDDTVLGVLCFAVVVAPAVVYVLLTLTEVATRPMAEPAVAGLSLVASGIGFVGSLLIVLVWWSRGDAAIDLEIGHWFTTGHYAFEIAVLLDRLSVWTLLLVTSVVFVIVRFAIPYMHREPGFTRFFGRMALFATGFSIVVLAGSIDAMLVGWECVGLASALLIAFFHERPAPPRSAVRVFTIYRLCDVGLLVGAMAMHGVFGSSDFTHAFRTTAWPGGPAPVSGVTATSLALCFALAAFGKSAQLPVGNWITRAMEGPTPSSALFYGGPAVHAGIFLLLRMAPLFMQTPTARGVLVVVGLLTSMHATVAWRTQTDQKSALAYATMTQLGLLVVECGLGWWALAQAHMAAHVCLRTFQLLRAPSALHDAHIIRATNAGRALEAPRLVIDAVPASVRRWLYRVGFERSFLEPMIDGWIVGPVIAFGRRCAAAERRGLERLGRAGSDRSSARKLAEEVSS